MPEITLDATPRLNGLYSRRKTEVDALLAKYPDRRSATMPLLWLVQEEDGWISPESQIEVAAIVGATPAQVNEVVSFYQMYNRAPVGKYVLGICGTLPCALCAADGLYEFLSGKLGIGWGDTTADGLFTIQRRECLGACSEAPVMLVNRKLETRLTRARIDRIIEECRAGQREPYFTGHRPQS
ncbi:MAG: NAD(P)H-dependent oxidoreductase subunit E [bacterium]|nr:NAD(P)H-dependent oxidoreductase subunit E [bacterium]